MRHEDRVSSASFSPDAKRVVMASGDRTARVWPLSWALLTPTEELLPLACVRLHAKARSITQGDVRAAPIVANRLGDDVCEGIPVVAPSP
jgi:WD40 repeat protein